MLIGTRPWGRIATVSRHVIGSRGARFAPRPGQFDWAAVTHNSMMERLRTLWMTAPRRGVMGIPDSRPSLSLPASTHIHTCAYVHLRTVAPLFSLAFTHVHSPFCAPSLRIVGAHWRRIACIRLL